MSVKAVRANSQKVAASLPLARPIEIPIYRYRVAQAVALLAIAAGAALISCHYGAVAGFDETALLVGGVLAAAGAVSLACSRSPYAQQRGSRLLLLFGAKFPMCNLRVALQRSQQLQAGQKSQSLR